MSVASPPKQTKTCSQCACKNCTFLHLVCS